MRSKWQFGAELSRFHLMDINFKTSEMEPMVTSLHMFVVSALLVCNISCLMNELRK